MLKIKRVFASILCTAILAALWGCAAYDERTMGTIMDDKTLASRIKYALLKDKTVKGLDIGVYVFKGHVFLVGAVEDEAQRDAAVGLAKSVKGMRAFEAYFLNKSEKSLGKTIDDTVITAKIKARLIKDDSISSSQIEVKTILGHVVLLGVVASEADVKRVLEHVKGVKNVQAIKSFLLVN